MSVKKALKWDDERDDKRLRRAYTETVNNYLAYLVKSGK
jgi:hypothetical protein